MLTESAQTIDIPPSVDDLPIVVVGTGPVGIRSVQELQRQLPGCRIELFGNEPWTPYNRVKLSSYLAGDVAQEEMDNSLQLPDSPNIHRHFNEAVTGIDRQSRSILTRYGSVYTYRYLVLATGSQPYVPGIPGVGLQGVYTFRDMTDTQRLSARKARSRNTLVIGGGLLGLEAAKAMRRFNTRVTVVEHNDHLMFRQLDRPGSALLRQQVESLGIKVITNDSVRQILGTFNVQGVELRSGQTLNCDTVILATGILPNVELAREAGLKTNRGILVNDQLQTSDPSIFAVGECVEHKGEIYGLVAPGYEQASVAACTMAEKPGVYQGSILVTSLKVLGYPVFSMGDVQERDWESRDPTHIDQASGIYRKLILNRGRLIGVIALGDWSEIPRLREMIYNHRRVMPWQLWRFRATGMLWPEGNSENMLDWPKSATICNCTGVSLGQLQAARAAGAATVADLTARTGAGSVCGTCKPLLANLAGVPRVEPVPNWRPLGGFSLLIALIALVLFLPFNLPYNDSVQDSIQWDLLWRDSLLKQISGYTLLGLGGALVVLSLRKRWRQFTWGRFDLWRLLHVIIGALALSLLILHTGLRMGHELNLWLMLGFTGLLLTGSMLGITIALEHRLPASWAGLIRQFSLWGHILLLWPIPALLGFHIAKFYYF